MGKRVDRTMYVEIECEGTCCSGEREIVTLRDDGTFLIPLGWRWTWLFTNSTPNGIMWRAVCSECFKDTHPTQRKAPAEKDLKALRDGERK